MKPCRLKRKDLRNWHQLGCAVTKSRTSWCYCVCTPLRGVGACGRPAPHGLRGRTDRAIEAHKKRKKAAGE